MNRRHPLALVAGGSVLLAAVPLSSLFASLTWMLFSAIAVGAVVGAAMLTRHLRGPVWAQVLAMMAALLLFLTLAFPSGNEFLRLIPTGSTFEHFNDLLVLAGQQIRSQSVPVPDLDALLLLTTLGVGLVAVLVDLVAVGLRRPALAGLPMLAMYSVPVAILPDGVPFVTFFFAAAGYMWLLVTDSVDRVRRFGRRFTGEGRDVDLWEPSPLAAAGRRLGLVGLVVAIVLPLALPSLSGGLLEAMRTSDSGGSGNGPGNGTGTTVDLSGYLTNQLLSRDNTLKMIQVSTTDPDPYYLRFGVADTIKDNAFLARSPSGEGLDTIAPPGTPDVPGVTSTHYEATVKVLPDFTMPLAPTFQQLISIDQGGLDGNWFWDANRSLLFSHNKPSANYQYTVQFSHVQYTPEALRQATTVLPDFRPLSDVPHVQQVSDLVDGLIAGQDTEYDRIRAIFDYFTDPRNNFIYSVVAPVSQGNNPPIVDFLNAKKGFCVQYAAAMAWLSRVAGYPARMAFGFTRGNGPNQQNISTLTNQNLHAWTEVYFPGFGWVPFDATPAVGVVGSVQTPWAHDPSQPGSPTPNPTQSGSAPAPEPPDTLHGGSPNAGNAGSNAGQTVFTNPWVLGGIALFAVLIALAITPAMRRRGLTRRRRARSGQAIDLAIDASGAWAANSAIGQLVTDQADVALARRDAHAAWAELHDTMIDFGVDVDDAETPRTTADRVGSLLGDARSRELTVLLGRAEERARYAPQPLRADGLNQALRTVRTGLAQQATRWERFTAVVLPRSVLLRWRLGLINRVANMVAASARARAALGAASPRRALSRATR